MKARKAHARETDTRGQYSKSVVTLILLVAMIFSAAVLVIFWHTGAEPATLVSCFFAGVIGELWFLAGIKKKKIVQENNCENQCREYEEDQR